jgi:DNA helicase-2/ATP-dependent DNA helicase PcrA
MQLMNELRELAVGGAGVGELVQAVLDRTGYIETLEAERSIEAEGRIENLRELVEVGKEFDGDGAEEDSSLAAFLAQVSLVADADERDQDGGYVTLMTLHNAKGLEFPHVFVIACEEGMFPHMRAIEEGSIEEERRLCYVAITRAERELTMSWARRRTVFGNSLGGIPSRFLSEIPRELLAGVDADDPATSGSSGGGWAAAALNAEVTDTGFHIGQDVTHESFGSGVITGIEPGGVVVIRFRTDKAERRLVASLAPLTAGS